jgi:hypothetical protein
VVASRFFLCGSGVLLGKTVERRPRVKRKRMRRRR